MFRFIALFIVILFIISVFKGPEIFHEFGGYARAAIEAIKDGYNGDPLENNP